MLKNFKVIELISSKTKALLTVYHNKLKFNVYTAPDLNYAPYVQLLMDPNGKCFAIMACDKDAPNAVPFSRPADAKPYPIVVRVPAAINQICTTMGWNDKTKYHTIPGQLFYDDKAIVFNLKDADEFTITPRNAATADATDDEESKSDDE